MPIKYYRVEYIIGLSDFVADSGGDEVFTFAQIGEKMRGEDSRFGGVASVHLGNFNQVSAKFAKHYKDGGELSHFTEEGGI